MQNGGLEMMKTTKRSEFAVFFILTFIMIPALTIGLVGAYGFSVWFYQVLVGGPPVG